MEMKFQPIKKRQDEEQNSYAWPRTLQEMTAMRERYGNAEQFLNLFTTDLQLTAATHPERAYFGTAPSLAAVTAGYGRLTSVVWICTQVENINTFSGVKEKMSVERQKELAGLFIAEYPYLKVSELLLFFHRLKCGRYGRFYGMVDALFITSAILLFLEERRTESNRFKAARKKMEEKTQQPASTGQCITYEEYLELKKRKERNNGKEINR